MDSILNTLIMQTFHFFRNEAVTIAGVCLAARGWPGCVGHQLTWFTECYSDQYTGALDKAHMLLTAQANATLKG